MTVGVVASRQPAQVAEAAQPVAAPADGRVDPDLLQLHGRRRPGRGLGLEQDDVVLEPQPRAPLLDLSERPPAEAVRVASERVAAELELVRRGARGQQAVEIVVVAARRPVSPAGGGASIA